MDKYKMLEDINKFHSCGIKLIDNVSIHSKTEEIRFCYEIMKHKYYEMRMNKFINDISICGTMLINSVNPTLHELLKKYNFDV
jgi:hypothetical protein